ncbi:threonine aldolase [Luteibacter sp. Sphag1AF]|uniref:threonine aldolase family protein n=1 Tax=Luteibacter sp. Sphag1AF TaxID=2587031 RepID=UPI0016168D32|nr:beta-eliminating lyase-related protein [Luteibacter sp. Sphag1AF]MBB3228277.1 threonine aldolase [Luteibacter sp. Sphag1AF]
MQRREFILSSLAAGVAAGVLPLSAFATAPKSPDDPDHIQTTVYFGGDSAPLYNRDLLARVDALLAAKEGRVSDAYLTEGVVAEMEKRFATLLGKEDAAFMPTGTLANQIALRLLCGDHRRAIVQQESHVYRDESDAVTILSNINVLPVGGTKAAPTLDEVKAAVALTEEGAYPLSIGAISLESPVRRADGAMVPFETVREIAAFARSKGIGLHLDGARLLLNSGAPGFDPASYSAPFDTVYVSLYKYLDAPFGAVLAGSKARMDEARATRHVFGGGIYHGWLPAILALDSVNTFGERFAKVRQAGDRLLDGLGRTKGYTVQRVPNGTNIHYVAVSAARAKGLSERLASAGIRIMDVENGRLNLTFNETLLRRDTDYLVRAFAS